MNPFSGSGGGQKPNWAEVDGCDLTGCTVQNNKPIGFAFEVTLATSAKELTVSLVGELFGERLEFELPEDVKDGCIAVDGGCPVAAGETLLIRGQFPLEAPSIVEGYTVDLELIVKDEKNDLVMCAGTTATITA